MGRRGTRPMPAAVAKAHGYKQAKGRRPPGVEPKVRIGTPALPASVRDDPVALDCWKRTRTHLLKMKVLSPPDGISLEGLCIAYSRAQKADASIARYGLLIEKWDKTLVANPAINISLKMWGEVRRFAVEFGLTPSSRARVREAPADTEDKQGSEESPEDFLFAKGKIVGSIGAHR